MSKAGSAEDDKHADFDKFHVIAAFRTRNHPKSAATYVSGQRAPIVAALAIAAVTADRL
jgi:hypothetical protein